MTTLTDLSAPFDGNSRVFFIPEPRSRAPYYAPEFSSREIGHSVPTRVYFPPNQPLFGHRQPKKAPKREAVNETPIQSNETPVQSNETPSDSLKLPSEKVLSWIASFSVSPRIPGLAIPREFAFGGGFDLLVPRWAIPAVWTAITQTHAMIVASPRFCNA